MRSIVGRLWGRRRPICLRYGAAAQDSLERARRIQKSGTSQPCPSMRVGAPLRRQLGRPPPVPSHCCRTNERRRPVTLAPKSIIRWHHALHAQCALACGGRSVWGDVRGVEGGCNWFSILSLLLGVDLDVHLCTTRSLRRGCSTLYAYKARYRMWQN